MRRGLAAAAVSAVVALFLVPLFAPPARAQSQGAVVVTTSAFALTPAPDANHNVADNKLFVDGHFHAAGGFQPAFDWVVVNLVWMGHAPPPPALPPYTICGSPPNASHAGPCSGADVDLNHHPLLPAPTYNGPYRVSAVGQASDQLGAAPSGTGSTPNIDFGLAAPPPPATAVTATFDPKTRDVTVSWARDTGTPDVQNYWIWRKAPGAKDFVAWATTPQLSNGERINVVDKGPECKGGDYTYEVETRRNGATGDIGSSVPSDRKQSTSPTITVPNGPPCTTTTPPTAPSKGGGPPPAVKGTPSGVTRNSGFSGSGSSSGATTPTSEAVTPDPGFVRGLPFAGSNAKDENGEGDNSAVAVTPGRHTSSGKGFLVPVASAAVLVLGALHLRIFKKRLDEPPSNLTPVV